jgi:NitT/TauT family transport system permease protein
MRRSWQVIWPPLVTFVLLHALWELIVRRLGVPAWKVPAPSDIFRAVVDRSADLSSATAHTSAAALLGFGLSALIGVAAGTALSSMKWIERAFYPFTVFLQTVPLVAIAPLLVLWLGYGLASVTVSAFIVSLFPVIANTLAGMRSVDPGLRDMFRLYDAGPLRTLFKLKLPAAMPNVFTGLWGGGGGEFVAGTFDQQGLGLLVQSASRNLQTPLVFAAVAAASLLGLTLFAIVNFSGYWILRRWHAWAR